MVTRCRYWWRLGQGHLHTLTYLCILVYLSVTMIISSKKLENTFFKNEGNTPEISSLYKTAGLQEDRGEWTPV